MPRVKDKIPLVLGLMASVIIIVGLMGSWLIGCVVALFLFCYLLYDMLEP